MKFKQYAELGNVIRQFMDTNEVPPALLAELLMVHGIEILSVACQLDHANVVKLYAKFKKDLLDLREKGTKISW